MPTYTAEDQINRALRLLGVLAEGETPSASESSDALMALNQMLDSWSTERLAVYCTMDQSETWPAGVATRTFGDNGDFGTRPIKLDPSTYYIVGGVSYPLTLINEAQYNAIPVKTTSGLPDRLFLNPAMPAQVTLYPVPDQAIDIHFISVSPLTEVSDPTQQLVFPPGYLEAFAYNLALSLAPEFGAQPSADVRRIAVTSKRNIKRINDPGDVMSMPRALIGRGYYDINTGE